ncbi:MAG: potassium transporter TrkG [Candidatus Aenigmarchaeota archaeon]|nr:potassium transporter TrkG [Candidatus Aenigmarchaeota archaeon]
MKPVLANLGFVLQIAGILILLPILVAYYYNEMDALISFFITAVTLFTTGFLLNSLCERKELDFKCSCVLISIVFILLGFYTSIPCQYLNPFQEQDIFSRFTNCYFESVSGSTTTGLTLLDDIDSLPRSIIFFRGLNQWIGGLGLVFILLTFFYPSGAIISLSNAIGIEKIGTDIKKTFIHILLIYTTYAIIFTIILHSLGFVEIIKAVSLVFSSLSTGGLSPATDFSGLMSFHNKLILGIGMIVGATTFVIHYRFFRGKFRDTPVNEFLIFILIVLAITFLMYTLSNLDIFDSFFHAVSASSTTGFSYVDISKFSENIKSVLILAMFIGGCSFSTAGGIKIMRLMLIFKSIPWSIKRIFTHAEENLRIENRELTSSDIILHMLVILLGGLMVFISSLIFTFHGFPFIDSLFESTSAFATTGLSTGIVNVSLPIYLKWLTIILMILGRVEIVPFLVTFSRIRVLK